MFSNHSQSLTIAYELIKHFESCELKEYTLWGKTAIGWGRDVLPGTYSGGISQAQADEFLITDVSYFASAVRTVLGKRCENGAYNAFVSFAYNVGLGQHKPFVEGFLTSSLLAAFLRGADDIAFSEILSWDHVGKTVVPGLLARRTCEQAVLRGHNLAYLESFSWFA
jgi:lysozyme